MDNQDTQGVGSAVITNVQASTSVYIHKRYGKYVYLFWVVTILWEAFFIGQIMNATNLNGFLVLGMIAPLVAMAFIYGNAQTKVRHEFMQQFASQNHFDYQAVGDPTNLVGLIFQQGSSQIMDDLISGVFHNCKFELFNYRYTIGAGKNSRTFYNTVFQIHFDYTTPHLLVIQKSLLHPSNLFAFNSHFSKVTKLQLEGSFDKDFSVTVEKEFEIEALQILTPEVMDNLMKNDDFSFEFFNQDLYIYHSEYILIKDELDKMYQLATYLTNELSPRLSGMSGSVKDLQNYQQTQ